MRSIVLLLLPTLMVGCTRLSVKKVNPQMEKTGTSYDGV